MSDSPPQVGTADSIDSRDSDTKTTDKKKSRRPANTAFRQQRLKAWQPILTPKTVLPLFFTIGIIFAPIGGLLLYASAQVQELRLDYTDCDESPLYDSDSSNFESMPDGTVDFAFKSSNVQTNAGAMWAHSDLVETYQDQEYTDAITCHLQFELPESMGPPVLMYYHLTNFYQNHRRYVASFSESQLKGEAISGSAVNSSGCTPLTADENGTPYYPCGLISNSIFNDTISSPLNLQQNTTYDMQNTSDIAWSSDKDLYGTTEYTYDEVVPPPNWAARYPNGYLEGEMPDISEDEAFMVWMRTAGLPEFSKLSRRNDDDAMEEGNYQIDIISRFPTKDYRGTKTIILSTRTVMGGRNPFLGIAYVVVGGICIILGAIFTVTHLIKPRKLGDHTYLSWNNAPAGKSAVAGPSTGMATGREVRPGDLA